MEANLFKKEKKVKPERKIVSLIRIVILELLPG